MDITNFNKELGKMIAIAKTYEIKGEIQAAIQQWIKISEMALNFSKSPKIDPLFKNMIINRTKGIFAHIKNLKENQIKEEIYIQNSQVPQEVSDTEVLPEIAQTEEPHLHEEKIDEISAIKSTNKSQLSIVEDSELKNLTKGFKEIETSDEFTIITPHDEDFVKKQHAKASEKGFFKPGKQKASEEDPKPVTRVDFEQPKNGNNLICFACGYDKNTIKDKVCKNCGIELN
ncbi:MAG: hypothetical protein CEE43_18425 [Promethearchaeota archaeon Loki_b32]|nr:MAG: hypothetical protein CEE43_18425 [Candidatus Lokiarchaeota archaeon Loki_b32]